jgi:hypothetical protein
VESCVSSISPLREVTATSGGIRSRAAEEATEAAAKEARQKMP